MPSSRRAFASRSASSNAGLIEGRTLSTRGALEPDASTDVNAFTSPITETALRAGNKKKKNKKSETLN
jgi:hypothetical protein